MKKNDWLKTLGLAAALVLVMLFLLSGNEKENEGETRESGRRREVSTDGTAFTAEDYSENYFRAVTAFHPGTAGSSLGRARAAFDALCFAQEHSTGEMETGMLRLKLLTAWNGLSEREREVFQANFIGVEELIGACFEDWESNRGLFDDAGVGEEMEALLAETSVKENWDALSAETRNLGGEE